MNRDGVFAAVGIMALVALFTLLIGFFTGLSANADYWKSSAIRHGAAHYHPETGAFTWNDEEKTK